MLSDSEDFKKLGEQIRNFSQHKYEKGMLPDLSNINMGALQKQQKNSYLADIKRLISNCKITGNFENCETEICFLFGIAEIFSKEFQALFKVLQFSNNKEKHLLRHWINVASKNFTEVIKKWYNL